MRDSNTLSLGHSVTTDKLTVRTTDMTEETITVTSVCVTCQLLLLCLPPLLLLLLH